MPRIVAIHQPNFFPWLGYFDKIRNADVFVFLDSVDYPRSGSGGMGSWVNRVRIDIQGKPQWVGCPVRRLPLGASISSVEIDDQQAWRQKLLRTLQANYRRAKNYEQAIALIGPLIEQHEINLARFNIAAIKMIASSLGLAAEFASQSQLSAAGEGTERLISLTRAVGGDTYLAGGGAGGYQLDHLFPTHGLTLQYQDFKPKPYGDPGRFQPGLSVIDYLMHDGRPLAQAFPEGESS